MENGVLGNALEGVHVEEEEGEKTEDESLVENNDNIDGMWSCMWHSGDATYIPCVQVMGLGLSLSWMVSSKLPGVIPASGRDYSADSQLLKLTAGFYKSKT